MKLKHAAFIDKSDYIINLIYFYVERKSKGKVKVKIRKDPDPAIWGLDPDPGFFLKDRIRIQVFFSKIGSGSWSGRIRLRVKHNRILTPALYQGKQEFEEQWHAWRNAFGPLSNVWGTTSAVEFPPPPSSLQKLLLGA